MIKQAITSEMTRIRFCELNSCDEEFEKDADSAFWGWRDFWTDGLKLGYVVEDKDDVVLSLGNTVGYVGTWVRLLRVCVEDGNIEGEYNKDGA